VNGVSTVALVRESLMLEARGWDKENVASIHSGILCSHEEEQNVIIHQ
jgi:hypothetical protein